MTIIGKKGIKEIGFFEIFYGAMIIMCIIFSVVVLIQQSQIKSKIRVEERNQEIEEKIILKLEEHYPEEQNAIIYINQCQEKENCLYYEVTVIYEKQFYNLLKDAWLVIVYQDEIIMEKI